MRLPNVDSLKLIANLDKFLQSSECVPIEAEWQRLKQKKKGKDPHWYSLFGGPQDVRSLADRLSNLAQYDICYRNWSNLVHAGGCLENYAAGAKAGQVHIRPIRHPDGLQVAVTHSVAYCMAVANRLLEFYGTPDDMQEFRGIYTGSIKPRTDQLHGREIIKVPWR